MSIENPPLSPAFNMVWMDAEEGARLFNQGSIKKIATSVEYSGGYPRNTKVLSIGLDTCEFGKEMCLMRPDVMWVNADPKYDDEAIREKAESWKPYNIEFIADDLDTLVATTEQGYFDRIYYKGMYRGAKQCKELKETLLHLVNDDKGIVYMSLDYRTDSPYATRRKLIIEHKGTPPKGETQQTSSSHETVAQKLATVAAAAVLKGLYTADSLHHRYTNYRKNIS